MSLLRDYRANLRDNFDSFKNDAKNMSVDLWQDQSNTVQVCNR